VWAALIIVAVAADLAGRTITVVHGACPTGADRHADQWARRRKVDVERYPADWKRYGKAAGFRRNQTMVDTRPDMLLAFIRANSLGATNTLVRAMAAGIPTWVWRVG
jgi:hypothetical protein